LWELTGRSQRPALAQVSRIPASLVRACRHLAAGGRIKQNACVLLAPNARRWRVLSIVDQSGRLCDGMSRRTMLRAGSLTAIGSLGSPLGSQLIAMEGVGGRAKSLIVLFLMGGPPQHSTWDPKPLAPQEVRGQIGCISTNVPGISIGELQPRTARMMDRLAVLRAVVTGDNAHSSSGYFMMTGTPHIPMNQENANPGFPNDHPNLGAVLAAVRHRHPGTATAASGPSERSLLPASVRLPNKIFNTDGSVWPGQGSGWLGHAADPWLFTCAPASPEFDVPQFRLAADVTLDRLSQRRTLLEQMEGRLREIDRSGALDRYGGERRQAFDLLATSQARQACDLNRETEITRERYGRNQFGQSVLLARRLIEAGVQCVQVNWFRGPDEPSDNPCWDSHTDETNRLRTVLVPPFDQALTALLEDLERTGRLQETVVACLSEFGRTPKFNARGGRDHWGQVFSVALAGGGVRGGQAIGASDEQGAWPVSRILRPQDITATLFHLLGYPPATEIHDPAGRPLPISRGEVVGELL
jgi:hypothetical protein